MIDTGSALITRDAAIAAASPVLWAQTTDVPAAISSNTGTPDDPRILFVRVIARRNFTGSPFWVSCAPEACAALSQRARAVAAEQGFHHAAQLAQLSPALIGVWRERMILPERPGVFSGKRDFKMVLHGEPQGSHILFGEAEHWTQIKLATRPAPSTTPPNTPAVPSLFSVAEEIARACARDEANAAFARAHAFGFLTSDPAHAGSGVQYEVGLHLPALAAHRQMSQIRQALAAMGAQLQPLSLREPGASEAGYFRMVSLGGLDYGGEESCRRFAVLVGRVVAAEAETWARWAAREQSVLEDRMHRALRLLQEARRMDFPELQMLTSFTRTGVYQGLFAPSLLPLIETLRVRAQPFHIQALEAEGSSPADTGATEAGHSHHDSALTVRAELARSLLLGY